MIILIFETTYYFSWFTYLFFPGQYSPNVETNPGHVCDTLLQCWMTTIFFGIPAQGGLFSSVGVYPHDNWDLSPTVHGVIWVIGIIAFHATVAIILVNVVFALVVDSFGEIRQQKKEAKLQLYSSCFICSLDKEIFQKYHVDFNHHIESEHGLLHYLYFFTYLKSKKNGINHTNLTKIESDLINMVDEGNFYKFLPLGRALSIKTHDESLILHRELEKSSRLSSTLNMGGRTQEKTLKQLSDMASSLKKIGSTISEMKTSISVRDGNNENN